MFASGGQGVVYVAHDIQIGRDVALKELKPRSAERPLSRSRFIREAEITGRLEHPGIVPVYALGKHPDGRPYYAMRLIQGKTLQDAVNHFYNPELTVTPAERRLLFRKLLQRFVSVCQTVAYAHSQSIVHRDIKPANILLGSYGEAMVADWGLAREFHPTDGCGSDPEITIEPGPGDPPTSESTQLGSALGTPAFMSPEQANGAWNVVGPVSDVYSLGATLYVILTGQSPLPKLSWPVAYKKIVTGDFPAVQQLNPKVPRALAAICRKAMSLKPQDRYPTALALAEDIEHYLADEPVAAEPTPLAERAGRWVRRHRTIVAGAAGLWFTFFVALGIGLVVVQGERDQKEIAHRYTLEALDRMASQAVEQWLRQSRDLSPAQRGFLVDLLNDYTRFTNESGSDPETRLRVTKAFRRVGEIRLRLGDYEEAASALANAEARGAKLGLDEESWHEWARIRTIQGNLAKETDRTADAERYFSEALSVLENRAFSDRDAAPARSELADGYNNHGASLRALGRGADAVAAFRAALRLREQLAADAPRSASAQLDVGVASANLGGCLLGIKEYDQAEQYLRAGITQFESAIADMPDSVRPREELAAATQKLGTVLYHRKKPAEASAEMQRAADQYERLAATHPNDAGYATNWAECLSTIEELRARPVEITTYDRAVALLSRIGESNPSRRLSLTLAQMHKGRAKALDRAGRHLEAADEWTKVPDSRPSEFGVPRTLRAMQLLKSGRVDQAVRELESTVADPNCSAMAIYNAACISAIAAQSGETERRSARAVELLRIARDRGFFESSRFLSVLDTDADLRAVRERADYKQFRESLTARPSIPS